MVYMQKTKVIRIKIREKKGQKYFRINIQMFNMKFMYMSLPLSHFI